MRRGGGRRQRRSLLSDQGPRASLGTQRDSRGAARHLQCVRGVAAQQGAAQCRRWSRRNAPPAKKRAVSAAVPLPPPRCSGVRSVTLVRRGRDSVPASTTPPSTLDAGGPKRRRVRPRTLAADTGQRSAPCAWPWTRGLRVGSAACRARVARP